MNLINEIYKKVGIKGFILVENFRVWMVKKKILLFEFIFMNIKIYIVIKM